jgi:type III pantothenate kinase
MTTLTLDLGNTALKYGVFTTAGLQASGVLAAPEELTALWQRHQPTHAILASVASEAEAQPWLRALRDYLTQILPLRPGFTTVPLQNAYATPQTLGADRLAGAVAAGHLRPGQPTLVLDAGTALKFDLVANSTFYGGSIAPGLRMRLRALHAFTGRLPLLELPEPGASVQLIGDSTASSLLSAERDGGGGKRPSGRLSAALPRPGLGADGRRRRPSASAAGCRLGLYLCSPRTGAHWPGPDFTP